MLVELFGSASAPAPAETEAWTAALLGKSVLLDYGAVLPLEVIAGGGGGALAEYSADSLLVVLDGDLVSVMLYADGVGCHIAQTALKTDELDDLLSAAAGGEPVTYVCALSASPAASTLTPHSVVPDETALASVLTREPLCGEDGAYDRDRQALILSAFGFDAYTARSYIDSDGDRVFLSELGSLRLGCDGTVSFAAGDAEGPAVDGAEGLTAYAGFSAAVLQGCTAGLTGQPRYCVSSIGRRDDAVVVEFDALADGRPLVSSNGARTAAAFVFEGGRLVLAELSLFTTSSGEPEDVRPSVPLETLLSGMNGGAEGGRLTPAYVQEGDTWRLNWCVLPVVRRAQEKGGDLING